MPGVWQHVENFSLSVLDYDGVAVWEEDGVGRQEEEGGGRLEETVWEGRSSHQEDQDCRRS